MKEADKKELIEEINILTTANTGRDQIEEVLDVLPKALAKWLKKHGDQGDGSYRGEIHAGLIFNLEPREGRTTEGAVAGEIPAHLALYVKATLPALDNMEATFEQEVRNG